MNQAKRTAFVATAGGVAAAFAMDAAQAGIAVLFERGRVSDERDEEVEAIEAVVRLIGTLVPSLASARYASATARVVHYGFGIAFAYAYVAARGAYVGSVRATARRSGWRSSSSPTGS